MSEEIINLFNRIVESIEWGKDTAIMDGSIITK